MKNVVKYQRNNPDKCRAENVEIQIDPADGFFYQKLTGDGFEETNRMPHASMFVYPNVPRPQHMETEEAKAITIAAMQWLSNRITRSK